MTTAADIVSRVERLNVWRQGDRRAPHKPLLLLLALAQVLRDEERLMPWAELAPALGSLLSDFGPPRAAQPELPFWHLQSDGLWEIHDRESLVDARGDRQKRHIPPAILDEQDARAGLPQDVWDVLRDDAELVERIADIVLRAHFPASIHDAILDAVGMPWRIVSSEVVERRRRDAAFREVVLRNYEHRCAVCGFDARLDRSTLGVEAAHVKWHAAGGPDDEDNGIALCVLHHRAFDRGAIGLTPELTIKVSRSVFGGETAQRWIVDLVGRPLTGPQRGTPPPSELYIEWHDREVFRPPPRSA